MQPIMVPDETSTVCNGVLDNSAPSTTSLDTDSDNFSLTVNLDQNTAIRSNSNSNSTPKETSWQTSTSKVCAPVSPCCSIQSLSTSTSTSTSNSMTKMTESPSRSSSPSNDDTHTHTNANTTMDSTKHHLSILHKMLVAERINRSTTNDHRALQDTKPSFHNHVWRERVAQWCFDVVDYLEELRDVASVAMNIIDRYIAVLSENDDGTDSSSSATAPVVIGEFDYEVISFTALFLAIRVSGSNKELEISQLLELSSGSGAPQAKHILSAGNSMLQKLSLDHQILTPNSFLHELVGLLVLHIQHSGDTNGNEASEERLSRFVDFASYLVEVSVCDIYFSAVAPSEIAFGALALAMTYNQDLFAIGCGHQVSFSRFFRTIREQTSMDIESPRMSSILSRLLHVYNQSQEAACESFGMESETVQWDRSHNNNNNNNITAHTTLPHIIADESETDTTATGGRLVSSNTKSEQAFILGNNDHRVNTDTHKIFRPVSPLPHIFR